jgi:hypothetical protein
MKGKHDMIMICDMFYYGFHARCISMYMSLNGTENMYTITSRLHRMIYVIFRARRINIPMSLNGTEHMYTITARLDMMIYKASCLDVLICLCFPKVWKVCI